MVAHQEERKSAREKNLARRGAFSKAEERRKNLQKDSPPKYNIISPPNSTPDKEETSVEEPLEMNAKIE
jgi:hypothetical protein